MVNRLRRQPDGNHASADWANDLLDSYHQGIFPVRLFGAKGNNWQDDTTACQAAIDQAQQAGGMVVFAPGDKYRLDGGLSITANRRILLSGYGATLAPRDNVKAISIQAGAGSTARGVTVAGLEIDGANRSNTTGLHITDTDGFVGRDLRFEQVTTALYFRSVVTWCERCALYDSFIRNAGVGIKFETAGGTGSFNETILQNVGIGATSRGIEIGQNANMYRSHLSGVTLWASSNDAVGLYIDGSLKHVTGDIALENIASARFKGIQIDTHATNTDLARLQATFVGNMTNISDPNGKGLTSLVWKWDGNDLKVILPDGSTKTLTLQ